MENIRKYLPGSTIILSTWEGSNTEGLDFDVLVENKDPGSNMMGTYRSNCFRQVVSSKNGLNASKTKYSIKIRADLEIKSSDFLNYFYEFNKLPTDSTYKILKQRIITMTTCNPKRRYKLPFTLSDWFFFGLTEDLKNLFDIPLIDEKYQTKDKNGFKTELINPFYPEQYIWSKFILKYKPLSFRHSDDLSNNNIELSERYFANNCIFLNAKQVKLNWLKSPGAAYAQIPCLSNSGLYSFNDYKKILNLYATTKLRIIPNPIEEILYILNDKSRSFVKKILSHFRKFI